MAVENKEARAIYKRLWRKDHPSGGLRKLKMQDYQKTLYGRLAHKAGSVNSACKKRGALDKLTKIDLLSVFKKQGGKEKDGELIRLPRCAICREELDLFIYRGFIVDHKIPLASGGGNIKNNIQFLCVNCDKSKTRKDHLHIVKKKQDRLLHTEEYDDIISDIKRYVKLNQNESFDKADLNKIVDDHILFEMMYSGLIPYKRKQPRGYTFFRNDLLSLGITNNSLDVCKSDYIFEPFVQMKMPFMERI